MIRALVACERSGMIRDALIAEGVDAMSCDLFPSDQPGPHHVGDVREILGERWDLLVAHPVCRTLANSGVRWLADDPQRWKDLEIDAEFFKLFLNANHIPHRCIENSIMHKYARKLVGRGPNQVVQPWWFGDPAFKGIALWLHGLRELWPTDRLRPPRQGSREHDTWSKVHRCSPGPERARLRANTEPGVARAMARQFVDSIYGDLFYRQAA